MSDTLKINLDRWLLCGPSLLARIGAWVEDQGDDSLLAFRLRRGLAETVALERVAVRFSELQQGKVT